MQRADIKTHKPEKTNEFVICIGKSPDASRLFGTIQDEIQMIKFGLLYGDKVKLYSLASISLADFAILLEPTSLNNLKAKIRAVERINSGAMSDISQSTWNMVMQVFNKYFPKDSPRNLSVAQRNKLFQIIDSLGDYTRDLYAKSGWWDIHKVTKDGMVELISAPHNTLCRINHLKKNRFQDGKEEGIAFLKDYYSGLFGSSQDGPVYPLVDNDVGKALIEIDDNSASLLSQAKIGAAKHVALAAQLMNRLPHFDLATTDEVIHIRNELSAYLTAFRSAISKYTKEISSMPWSTDIAYDAEKYFVEQVGPSVEQIEEAVENDKYLFSLSSRFLAKMSQSKLALATSCAIIAGLTSVGNLHLVGFGAFLGTLGLGFASILEEIREWQNELINARDNQMFFYYATREMLADI